MESPIIQFLNQFSFLFVCAALLVGMALQLRLRQASRRWWGVWGLVLVGNVGVVAMLPTPAATLSEHEAAESGVREVVEIEQPTDRFLGPQSIAEIETLIANGKRPTLVEFYSDFGIG